MTTWTDISTLNTDAEDPVTTGLITGLKNNTQALSEGNGPTPVAGEVVVGRVGYGGENTTEGIWNYSYAGLSYTTYNSDTTNGGNTNFTVWRAGTYRIRFGGYGDGGTSSGNNSALSLYKKPVASAAVLLGSVTWPVFGVGGYEAYADGGNDYKDFTLASGDELYFLATCRNNGTAGPVFLSLSTSTFTGPIGA